MKKTIILSAILIAVASINASATIHTLNNNNPSPGQYTSFAAAESGLNFTDTIYVSGSPISYGDITNNYGESLIGTGFNPDKQNPLVATFGTITIGNNDVIINGIVCNVITEDDAQYTSIHNCKINFEINVLGGEPNMEISGCVVLGDINVGASGGSLILYNSIIAGTINAVNVEDFSIYNNVFINNGIMIACQNYIEDNVKVRNNIFYGKTPGINGGALFGNDPPPDFSYNCSLYIPFSQYDNGNNIIGDPLFVSVPALPDSFTFSQSYHLQPASPCITNTGDDGKQRGLYGGSAAFFGYIGILTVYSVPFSDTGEPAIPQIKTMSAPASAVSGQSININFSSKTNQ